MGVARRVAGYQFLRRYGGKLGRSHLGRFRVNGGVPEGVGPLGILPYLRRIIRDEIRTTHPKEEVQALAGSDQVRYEMNKTAVVKGDARHTCVVYVGGRKIAEACHRGDINEAQVKAAIQAVSILRDTSTS